MPGGGVKGRHSLGSPITTWEPGQALRKAIQITSHLGQSPRIGMTRGDSVTMKGLEFEENSGMLRGMAKDQTK